MKQLNIKIAFVFIWLGFIGAISFMEAWLKFRAPGITLELGLSVGDLVFAALNKVELFCAALILILSVNLTKINQLKDRSISFIIVISILLFQTLWLKPKLSERVDLIINHQPVEDSHLHLLFVVVELIKTLCLIIYGISLFKKGKNLV